MKVRLLTNWLGKGKGDLLTVAPQRGHLWVKNGVAEYTEPTDKLYAPKPVVVKPAAPKAAPAAPDVADEVPAKKPVIKPAPKPKKYKGKK